jgi:hypothetical protein
VTPAGRRLVGGLVDHQCCLCCVLSRPLSLLLGVRCPPLPNVSTPAQVIYIAPLKALVRERMNDWSGGLCRALGKKLVELTGVRVDVGVCCLLLHSLDPACAPA